MLEMKTNPSHLTMQFTKSIFINVLNAYEKADAYFHIDPYPSCTSATMPSTFRLPCRRTQKFGLFPAIWFVEVSSSVSSVAPVPISSPSVKQKNMHVSPSRSHTHIFIITFAGSEMLAWYFSCYFSSKKSLITKWKLNVKAWLFQGPCHKSIVFEFLLLLLYFHT